VAEPGAGAAGFLVGIAVNITFAMFMAFFRATYLDFWGVVVVRGDDVDLDALLHHRRAVRRLQDWHLVPISGFAAAWSREVPRARRR
jgi:peptide/nickel transport system permease protein